MGFIDVREFEQRLKLSNMNSFVIRERKYNLILFGNDIWLQFLSSNIKNRSLFFIVCGHWTSFKIKP